MQNISRVVHPGDHRTQRSGIIQPTFYSKWMKVSRKWGPWSLGNVRS